MTFLFDIVFIYPPRKKRFSNFLFIFGHLSTKKYFHFALNRKNITKNYYKKIQLMKKKWIIPTLNYELLKTEFNILFWYWSHWPDTFPNFRKLCCQWKLFAWIIWGHASLHYNHSLFMYRYCCVFIFVESPPVLRFHLFNFLIFLRHYHR